MEEINTICQKYSGSFMVISAIIFTPVYVLQTTLEIHTKILLSAVIILTLTIVLLNFYICELKKEIRRKHYETVDLAKFFTNKLTLAENKILSENKIL